MMSNIDGERDRSTVGGANPLRAGVGLLEGMVHSGRLAVGELEKGLKRTDDGGSPELRVVAESVTRGYVTFFSEMTRTARRLASEYRSESGRLVSKPRLRADEDVVATPPEQAASQTASLDAESAGGERGGEVSRTFGQLAERLLSIVRLGVGDGR